MSAGYNGYDMGVYPFDDCECDDDMTSDGHALKCPNSAHALAYERDALKAEVERWKARAHEWSHDLSEERDALKARVAELVAWRKLADDYSIKMTIEQMRAEQAEERAHRSSLLFDDARKQTTEALRERDEAREEAERLRSDGDAIALKLDHAQAHAATLREALERYGQHEEGCGRFADACTCGFSAALAAGGGK